MYDELLEAGVKISVVEEVLDLINDHVADERADAVSSAMVRVLGWLAEDAKTMRLKIVGLAFAVGRQDLFGYKALDDAAQAEGISHTGIANWRQKAVQALTV